MKKYIFSTLLTLVFTSVFCSSTHILELLKAGQLKPNEDYVPNKIILKLRSYDDITVLENAFNKYILDKPYILFQKFPTSETKRNIYNALHQKYTDIKLIYQLNFDETEERDMLNIIQQIQKTNTCEYVEPKLIRKVTYTPNDPNLPIQWHIGKIQAEQAWDFSKGDSNIVIGILDTGTDLLHSDLLSSVKYNINDPVNGLDDDGDGYIDNIQGWDFVDNDNTPDAQSPFWSHGVLVQGCAAATTDNNMGISAPAFNSKVLPVRCGNGSTISYGYEGMVYAADMGCQFINCSWGGPGYSDFEKDIIQYVSINKGALVVAACGNNGNETIFYPGAYPYVLNVASTKTDDSKSSFSNYGSWVDVSAPGESIYTTDYNNSYTFQSGTSLSSPIAAGASALIKSQFPFLTSMQVGQLLKITSDNIDAQNPTYIGKLGYGRINLFNAMQNAYPGPALEINEYILTDYLGDVFTPGDTAFFSIEYINYLAVTGNCNVTITSASPYISILNPTQNFGIINTLSTKNNFSSPWKILMSNSVPLNTPVTLTVSISDGVYIHEENITFSVHRDYINITVNDIGTTVTSRGLFGYNDFASQQQGLGFVYPYTSGGANLLFEGGLMVGIPGKVSNVIRSESGLHDMDFEALELVKQQTPGISSMDVHTTFNDNIAALGSIPVKINHKTYAWNTPGHTNYILMEYTLVNTGGSPIQDLFVGLYADWDVGNYYENKSATQLLKNLGYVYRDVSAPFMYTGIRLISPNGNFNHYAFEHVSGGAGGIDITDNFTITEKYEALSTPKFTAGGLVGNDVSHIVSAGPFFIAPNDSQQVVFALLAGNSLNELEEISDSAALNYQNEIITYSTDLAYQKEIFIYPNPSNDIQYVHIFENYENLSVHILDMLGREHGYATLKKGLNTLDCQRLSEGVYTYVFMHENRLLKVEKVIIH